MKRVKAQKSANMLSALKMQLVSKYSNVVVQLIVTMVLARLLTPEEYGTVAVVTVFTSFFSILADVGVSTAIIQYKDLEYEDFNALFFFCMILGLGLAAFFCLLSLPISMIYNEGELIPLCCLASLSVLFASMNMVPNGVLMCERRFSAISVRLVVASLVSGVVAIALAAAGAGCYSLVWQSVTSSAVILAWNCAATHVNLGNRHFVAPLKKIWRFSIYQAGFSTINYFARNLDNLLVGAIMGSAQLGQYDKAYKLMGYPLNYLTGIFSDVLQPYLSEYQDNKKKLYESWLSICKVLALVGMFVTAVFICFPREIILVMYGDQWLPAVPVLAALGLSVGVQMVNTTSGAIFQSAGRTDQLFKSGVICTCVTIVAILIGVSTGSIALLGLCVSLAYFVHLYMTALLLVKGVLGVRVSSFLKSFLPSIAAAIAAIGVTYFVGWLTSGLTTVLNVVIRALVCCLIYGFVMRLTGEWKSLSVFQEMKKIGVEDND
ncbi:MAG: lipopolysaccharide biosynthesis protein [Tractidigestivibacter sp.]|uniref:lipopolysaccharide biosynthesis protein n=1 Tax=Tractidigestivibacter sp. TaxID=2847320 RepID=UPI003D918498